MQPLKLISNLVAPSFRQGLDLNRPLQQVYVFPVAYVESHNVANLDAVFVSFDQLELIARSDLALCQNREVKAASLALQKPLDDVGTAKLEAKFVTRHAWFCDHDGRRADAELVADIQF